MKQHLSSNHFLLSVLIYCCKVLYKALVICEIAVPRYINMHIVKIFEQILRLYIHRGSRAHIPDIFHKEVFELL